MTSALPSVHVELGGLLGEAIAASQRGRLSRFIVDGDSPALRLFAPAHREHNLEGDWYGEHAGKWLLAAARAAARSGDAALRDRVLDVAHFLVAQQTPDGYLGTYAASHRFMQPQAPKPDSWDGAPAQRSWDIWIHAYLILGLLEVQRHFPDARVLQAARRIGDLCWRAFVEGGADITLLGNHHGLSASVLLDPAAQLYLDTGDARYLQLAERVLAQADAEPRLALLRKALAGADAAEIATGKAYQLQWMLVGLAKLWRATGRDELKSALDTLWTSIRRHHLTLGGGPWGGVAHRSREVFNAPGTFSPRAYVETCSTLSWIQLNRELLAITGDVRHAEEIERSAYNDLLGALAPNGEDWCYYVFPNGRRVHTTYWRCCKSSGAMALEELPLAALTASQADDGQPPLLTLNLHGPLKARVQWPDGGTATLRAETRYPFEGQVDITLDSDRPLRLRLRIPAWADGARCDGADAAAGRYLDLARLAGSGQRIVLQLPMTARMHGQASRNVQESRAPDGAAVRQEVLHHEHVAFTRGPLVYATGLIDGFKTDETVRLPAAPMASWLQTLPCDDGPTLRLALGYRAPIDFVPYYRAGGRTHGAWRLTWLSLAPSAAPPLTEEPDPTPST